MKQELGKLFLDLAKILFATTFLGAIINDDINKITVGILSGVLIIGFILIGLKILRRIEK